MQQGGTKMKCLKCGSEIENNMKFCFNCGEKVKTEVTESTIPPEAESIATGTRKKNSLTEKTKNAWSNLTFYGKLTTVLLAIFFLMCLIAFLTNKIFAGVIALVAVALTVVALLIRKEKIKTSKKWLDIVAIILAIVLVVPYISVFRVDYGDAEKFDWSKLQLSEAAPKPHVSFGEIMSDSEEYMCVYIYKTTPDKFDNYIDDCEEFGYTIDVDESDRTYYAFNNDGYKVSLYFFESDNVMSITVEAPEEYGTIEWPTSGLAGLLPAPKSTIGTIDNDDEKAFKAHIADMPIDEFKAYVKECRNKGFNEVVSDNDKYYSAKNDGGYKVTIDYQGYNVVAITVYEPEYEISIEVKCEENWFFDKYDIDVYINDEYESTLAHGSSEKYVVAATKGNYVVKFVNAEDEEITGQTTIEVSKNEDFKFEISCHSSEIKVKTTEGMVANESSEDTSSESEATTSTKITVTMSEDELKGLDKTDAENKLREMGFKNISYDTIETTNSTIDNMVASVEIKSWQFGKGDFSKGDTYAEDAIVVIWYYEYTGTSETESSGPVFYSTNDRETAKNGNTGVFAYKNKGGTYDVYWIIDFDEGYVYYFTDGNGESSCDKVKIVSGTLNDRIKVTWQDGGDEWSWYLNFKYKGFPETLVVTDHFGASIEFTTTDLDDALNIRKTKKIKNY